MSTNVEKGQFVRLFIRGSYVLNLATGFFGAFTMTSMGMSLCERYVMSKGNPLKTFVNEADDDQSSRLLSDILDYYEANYSSAYEVNR